MKILNFGSLNVDYVYRVQHIMLPGETQQSLGTEVFAGGKGLNQSIAIAKTGMEVFHAGLISRNDSQFLLDICKENHVRTDYIKMSDVKSGHTIIQVDDRAQNSILLYGGSNRMVTRDFVDEVLSNFTEGDVLVLQNEINMLPYIIDQAFEKKMKVILNPSPYNDSLKECDMSKISIFLVNEIEGRLLAGEEFAEEENADVLLDAILERYPSAGIVLTLGEEGAFYCNKEVRYFQKIFPVEAVDTTAAGDTFTGYFIYGCLSGLSMEETLKIAAKASSIAVSRKGAAPSIPTIAEVKDSLK